MMRERERGGEERRGERAFAFGFLGDLRRGQTRKMGSAQGGDLPRMGSAQGGGKGRRRRVFWSILYKLYSIPDIIPSYQTKEHD